VAGQRGGGEGDGGEGDAHHLGRRRLRRRPLRRLLLPRNHQRRRQRPVGLGRLQRPAGGGAAVQGAQPPTHREPPRLVSSLPGLEAGRRRRRRGWCRPHLPAGSRLPALLRVSASATVCGICCACGAPPQPLQRSALSSQAA
jgi:hypothetical protein